MMLNESSWIFELLDLRGEKTDTIQIKYDISDNSIISNPTTGQFDNNTIYTMFKKIEKNMNVDVKNLICFCVLVISSDRFSFSDWLIIPKETLKA